VVLCSEPSNGVVDMESHIWRTTNGRTWREEPDLTTMQLVPSVVSNRLGHVGGIRELNGGESLAPIGGGP